VSRRGFEILFLRRLDTLTRGLQTFSANVVGNLLEGPVVTGFRHRRAMIGEKDRILFAYIPQQETERPLRNATVTTVASGPGATLDSENAR